MLYQATHITRYKYEEPVSQCLTEARLVLRPLSYQHVHTSRVHVHPAPVRLEERADYFGNRVTAFSVFHRHDLFVVKADSVVEVLARPAPETGIPWEQAREMVANPAGEEELAASEFVHESPFAGTAPDWAAYGRESFRPGRALVEALMELSTRIYRDFKYQPKATSIDMPLAEVFRLRRGVCQDFAHVMIGVLRSLGLPARYVSGYLRSGASYQGAEASHAWMSAFVPGYGWLDLDPTNNVVPGEGHVTAAWGRDYGDVTPVKGISLGGGGQVVDVEVSVRPVTPSTL